MSASPTHKKYIQHLHAFRGFAILTIVAAHSWSFLLFTGDFDTMPDKLVVYSVAETLFHGSTIYFAVISGLLFGLVLRDKGWKAFFRSKALNVFMPYALVSLFFLSVFWPMSVQWFESEGMSTNFLVAYTNGLLTGKIMLPFWYIPILMMLYAATPVIDKMMHKERLRWLAGALVLLPMVISRTTALDFIRDLRFPLWIAAVGCSLVVLLLFLNEYEPSGQYSLLQTLVYAQKLSITALMIHYLSRNEESLPRVLFVLGSYAFAIYFLHFFMVNAVAYGLQALASDYASAWTAAAGGIVILVAATSLSLLLSWLLKKLFRSKSRMAIGA